MNLAFAETELPVRLRFERSMTDAELLRFCEANEVLRVERDANGEILVMTPAGFGSSKMNVRISRLLDEWAEEDG
jgi:Uma2 family endonuclease